MWAALAAILAGQFVYVMAHFAPAICEPDANGYWAQGSLLFTTGRTWFEPECDAQYIGMHWLVTESGKYYSRYPPGLAVLTGLVYRVLGFEASVLVNPVLATASLAGLFFLLRLMMGRWWSLAGVFVLAANPVFNQHALACDSHMAVTFCLIWGLFFLLRWSEHGKVWTVFLAGLILGCIPAIRYPEALFALGIGVFVLWRARTLDQGWLHCIAAAIAAAIPLVPVLIRNQLAFGAFYRTAYALTNEQTGFGWDYFTGHFTGYIHNMHGEGVGLFFPLGVIGMIAMCCMWRWRRIGVLLVLLTVPSTLLYMAYYWGPGRMGGATMRFLLPTFTCYIAAGLWAVSQATARARAVVRPSVLAAVLVLQLIWGASGLDEMKRLRHQKESLARVTGAVERCARRGDVIIADQQVLQHLDFVRRWRLGDLRMTGPDPARGRFMRENQAAGTPRPMQAEKVEKQADRYRGLTPSEREREIASDILDWAGSRRIYFVGTRGEIERMRGRCFSERYLKIVEKVQLPEPPVLSEREGMMGGAQRRNRRAAGPGGFAPAAGPGGPDGDQLRPPEGGLPQMPLPPPDGMPARRSFRGDFRPPRGGPWGPMGWGGAGGFGGEKEAVIAEWTYRKSDEVEEW